MKPRLLVAAVAVAAVALALLLGSRSSDDGLVALQRDPLAIWRPETTAGWRELGRRADGARGTRPASVRASFAVERGGDSLYRAALFAARAGGWSVYDIDRAALSPPVRRTATARKSGGEGRELRGVIVLSGAADDPAAGDELTVELTSRR